MVWKAGSHRHLGVPRPVGASSWGLGGAVAAEARHDDDDCSKISSQSQQEQAPKAGGCAGDL